VTLAFDWRAGDEKLQRAVEAAFATGDSEGARLEVLQDRPGRRRMARLRLPCGEDLLLKHFAGADHRHSLRERVKNAVGLSTGSRERRALERLRAAGIAVPALRGFAVLSDGGRVLATEHLDGVPLRATLGCDRAERGALLAAVGALIRALHAGGSVHGDLHAGNIFVTGDGPVLLDLGGVRRCAGAGARRRDLGTLDHSLSGLLSAADRVRLRAAALGLCRPFDAAARRELRAVGRASARRARRHAASRTRRALAPGRRFAHLELGAALGFGAATGLRRSELAESEIRAALVAHRSAQPGGAWTLLKSDARSRVTAGRTASGSWVIKEYRTLGWRRALGDVLRGSPARRAWLAGHGLLARGIGAAGPAAFLETRRWALPIASAIVLEDLRRDAPADAGDAALATAAERVDALRRLVVQLHRRGVDHGDLKASHVYLRRCDGGIETRLIDLEGVRFRRRLRDGARRRALAQLNASLGDDVDAGLRCDAFRRYASALPFARSSARGRDRALRRIVRASLRREHRWTGAGCDIAGGFPGDPTPNAAPVEQTGGEQTNGGGTGDVRTSGDRLSGKR
jgi:tRNA A-37 threonylcarbamoyl transferase component Bud32